MKTNTRVARRCRGFCAMILMVGGGVSSAAWADDLEEIVVTAQRREQNLQEVGVSVTALSGTMLRDLHVENTQQLGSQVPGLSVQSYSQAITVFNIRGVSQNDFGDQEEAPIAVYNDDAYNSYLGGVGGSLFDVERVEVLKGPQGTLFGRNATGGLINIISKRPTDTFEGYGELTGGSFGRHQFEGAISGPLVSDLSGRLALHTEKSDGYYQNLQGGTLGGTNNISWRGQLLYKPTRDLKILFNFRGMRDDTTGAGYTIQRSVFDPARVIANGLTIAPSTEAAYAAFCNAVLGGYSGAPGYGDCNGGALNPRTPWTANQDNRGYFRRNQYAGTFNVDYQNDALSLSWLTDYNRIRKNYSDDTDATALNFFNYFQNMASRQFSSEFRAAWHYSNYRITAGVNFLDIKGAFSTGFNYAQFGAYFNNPFSQRTRSEAAFTQGEYDFASKWTAVVGVRYTETRINFDYVGTCHDEPATQFFLGCVGFGLPDQSIQTKGYQGTQHTGDTAGKLELDWHPKEKWLIYASITRGNKAGGFNAPALGLGLSPSIVPFKPELLTSYETGLKSTLFDSKLRFNASIFYYRYHNYQAFNLINTTQVVFNADAAAHGAEFSLQTARSAGWEGSLGVSLLRATTFDLLLPDHSRQDQVIPLAPRATINGVIRKVWTLPVGEFSAQTDFNYLSSRSFNSLNSPILEDGPHTIVNASVGFHANDHWELRAFVTNIGNTAQKSYTYDDSTVNGATPIVYAPPRAYGGSVRFSW